MYKGLAERKIGVNLIENPGVPRGMARFRLQLQANHRPEHFQSFVHALNDVAKDIGFSYDRVSRRMFPRDYVARAPSIA